MIYIAVHSILIFSAGPRGSEVVQEVLADLKSCNHHIYCYIYKYHFGQRWKLINEPPCTFPGWCVFVTDKRYIFLASSCAISFLVEMEMLRWDNFNDNGTTGWNFQFTFNIKVGSHHVQKWCLEKFIYFHLVLWYKCERWYVNLYFSFGGVSEVDWWMLQWSFQRLITFPKPAWSYQPK